MDLLFDSAADEFRAEVRAWLTKHAPRTALPSMDTAAGFEAHREWEATMAADRMSVVSWPEEYGGRNAPLLHWVIFEEEYFRSGAPGRVSQNGIFLLAPTLFEHASKAQLDRIMPRMARADDIWGQAWSEPESGSDLASLRSTATRTEGGWLLNGQKTWSSRSSFADWAFGLFRSDRDAQRHKGITYFMFDLRSPGVTVRPIAQLDGEPGFAELFLENVFVPDDPANPAESGVIGEVNNGWRVAMSTAANERGLSLRAPGRFLATTDRLVDLWKRNRTEVPAAADVDRRVADAWIGSRAYELSTYQTVSRLAAGGQLGMESSINKVFWSQWDIAAQETALDLQGTDAEIADEWTDGYLFSLSGPIYAGTNEIQRNVIAERLLGLPRGDR
ncbi:acyl-CoA dehydrogenase family protein [Gordonia sp. (in: high G+C Gram-positive bacteria)]|jgi:alkylation response protein AidB-like acyl-CoA dehydrogenase|uniref:acyl-CoA dehydrogenase family protein n=3 Tax=Gordonia sp. (in: high G+C Gram-positive bacteria) TaxID=84139 RepID=UPI0026255E52|nr:acyl-CoA dehydrogenase family protein [Gordonia sp. (in: high G+C Gram-positive bacteria)]HMS77627.1 acyl-CoA dehydrogenase family protein [Gordonia sp. (in: high G+C Gram-positive bacteria)]HQV18885.1 acyl-CoA dehydrogenase family protein [Gordonia sp. (in: high G+C Gram-positive bacteria)]